MARPKSKYEIKSIVKTLRFKPSILKILLKYGEIKNLKGLSNIIEQLILSTKI